MNEEQFLAFPFLTRKMLAFEFATSFSVTIYSKATKSADILLRGATRSGIFTYRHRTIGLNGAIDTFALNDIPIWLSVFDVNSVFIGKDCYITVDINVNSDAMYRLCAGYVSAEKSLTYPQAQSEPVLPDSIGLFNKFQSTNPLAGEELQVTSASQANFKIRSIQFELVTAAVVASRVVHLVINDGFVARRIFISGTPQTISQTITYNCQAVGSGGTLVDGVANNIIIPLPEDLLIGPGADIATETTALDAGDNYGVMTVFGEQFLN